MLSTVDLKKEDELGDTVDNFLTLIFFATQATVTRAGQEVELRGKGRHDPCVLPRAVPMVEAMVALTLVDHLMLQKAQCELFPNEASVEDRPNPMGVTAVREGGPAHFEEAVSTSGQRIDEE